MEDCLAELAVNEVLRRGQAVKHDEEAEASTTTQLLLGWPRTRHDPFKEVWELIATWVQAHPERSCSEMFQELQRRFPERYQSSQLRTLQRGVRKIRARLPTSSVGYGWQEVIQAEMAGPVASHQQEWQTDQTTGHGRTQVSSCAGGCRDV